MSLTKAPLYRNRQIICSANQLTDFDMKGLFAVERLKKLNIVHVYFKQYYHLRRSTTM